MRKMETLWMVTVKLMWKNMKSAQNIENWNEIIWNFNGFFFLQIGWNDMQYALPMGDIWLPANPVALAISQISSTLLEKINSLYYWLRQQFFGTKRKLKQSNKYTTCASHVSHAVLVCTKCSTLIAQHQ